MRTLTIDVGGLEVRVVEADRRACLIAMKTRLVQIEFTKAQVNISVKEYRAISYEGDKRWHYSTCENGVGFSQHCEDYPDAVDRLLKAAAENGDQWNS